MLNLKTTRPPPPPNLDFQTFDAEANLENNLIYANCIEFRAKCLRLDSSALSVELVLIGNFELSFQSQNFPSHSFSIQNFVS